MLRRLLTLLAVISGFTLTAQPLQAAETNVVSVAQAAERVDCAVQGMHPVQLAEATARGPHLCLACERPALGIPVPTVMLRVDRSRE